MALEQLPFPAYQSTTFPMLESEPEFDADQHLALEMPDHITTLEAFGYDRTTRQQSPSDLAVTAPFSILSDAGAEAVKQVGAALKQLNQLTENNPEAAYIKPRGSAYSSKFFQSFWHCSRVTEFFSDIAGTALVAHPLASAGAAFIYAPAVPSKSNQGWHLDSVGFTSLIALNDPGSLEGGGFQYFLGTRDEVAALAGTSADDLRTSVGHLTELPTEKVVTIKYPRAGHGVLLQGNLVLHRGQPLRTPAKRMVFAVSYMAEDANYPDVTNWREIAKWNSPTMRPEYARHKAWRAKQLLESVSALAVDDDPQVLKSTIELAMSELSCASEELER